jgi:hypothetical protein
MGPPLLGNFRAFSSLPKETVYSVASLAIPHPSLWQHSSLFCLWRFAYFGHFTQMESYMGSFVSVFFHLAWFFKVCLCCRTYQHCILIYGQIIFHHMDIPTVYFSICQLRGIKVFSTFWLLWIMLPWPFLLWGHLFLVILCVYTKEKHQNFKT